MAIARRCTSDDDILVARARDGDREAFAALVARYQRVVYALAYRRLGDAQAAQDATQETFLRAYRHLAQYRPSGRFPAWLAALAHNWCTDQQRRRTVAALADPDGLPLLVPAADEPEGAALAAERQRAVARWLGRLPEPHRRAVELRYFQGFTYREIGAALGESVAAVRMRLHRARRALARAGHPEARTE